MIRSDKNLNTFLIGYPFLYSRYYYRFLLLMLLQKIVKRLVVKHIPFESFTSKTKLFVLGGQYIFNPRVVLITRIVQIGYLAEK